KQPSRATTPVEPTDVQRTEVEQFKIVLKRSRQETHISQQSGSGTDEVTGSKPGVPDVPSDDSEEELSWKSSDDEDVDDDDNDEEEELAKDDEEDKETGKGDDKAYKEYHACAMGEATPKPKASARKKKGDSTSSTTPPTLTPTTTVESSLRLCATAKGKQPSTSLDQTGGLKDKKKEVSRHQLALHLKKQPRVQADQLKGLNLDNCLPVSLLLQRNLCRLPVR
nr:hypothetical protein [Tanacetum cinerariifolium]